MSIASPYELLKDLDQRFRRHEAYESLLVMPQFDLCLAAAQAAPEADLVLSDCEPSMLNSWLHSESRLRLESSPKLCITIGPEAAELTSGGRQAPTRYVSRSVAMQSCSTEATARQLFTVSPPLDIPRPLLPEESR